MPKAAIIGGGIAGLTTGLFLKKNGWEVVVCETAPVLLPVGKGIWVPTNGMQILAALDLADSVANAGWALSGIEVKTVGGKTLGRFDLGDVQKRFGFTTISIHRSRLIGVLAKALGAESLRLNARFKGVEERTDGLAVHLDSGDCLEADLLVGADGLHSLVREYVQPGVKLVDSGQSCARGIARICLPASLKDKCQEIWGGRFRFGFSAIGPDEVYWFAPFTETEGALVQSPKEFLLEGFAAFPPVVLDILRNTPEGEILLTRMKEVPNLEAWSKGRIQLVGDAAHGMTPNLGQGGAQAMEDAYFLGKELAVMVGNGTGKNVATVLSGFSRRRFGRVYSIAKTARMFGNMAHWGNPAACWLRDSFLRLTPARINRARLDGIYKIPEG